MIGIDTNIFLYSLNPTSQWHGAAIHFLGENLGNRSVQVVLTDYVLVELYILLRNPAVMKQPLSAGKARDLVTAYLGIPNVIRVENAKVMDAVWKLAGAKNFQRRRIFDARLALTLRQCGVTQFATTNVKDFEDWGFSTVWNPLLG